ncbi:hypothetical protein CRUP_027886 [Coryphaenoides rupestris]|nr:hypothetical protein CRUP_027886 [Coryphaenoides rupestris]
MELTEPGNSEPPRSTEHGKLDIDILPIRTTGIDATKHPGNPGNLCPLIDWDHPLLNDSHITEQQKLRYVVDWAQNFLKTRSEVDSSSKASRTSVAMGKQEVPQNRCEIRDSLEKDAVPKDIRFKDTSNHTALEETKQATETANANSCYTSERLAGISVYERYLLYADHLDQLRSGQKECGGRPDDGNNAHYITDKETCVRSREAKGGRRRAEWGSSSGSRGPPEVLGEVQSVLVVPHAWRGVAKPAGVVVFDQWLRLPDEVWLCVLSLLPHAHLSSVAQVCHRMHRLAHDHTLCESGTAVEVHSGVLTEGWLLGLGGRRPHSVSLYRCSGLSVTPRGLEAFLSLCVASLQELNVTSCVGPGLHGNLLLRLIGQSCQRLTNVNVSWSGATDTGLASLIQNAAGSLDVSGCKAVTDAGVRSVALGCRSLRLLDLSSTSAGSRGLAVLADMCNGHLHTVKLSFCHISPESIIRLCRRCKRAQDKATMQLSEMEDEMDLRIQAAEKKRRSETETAVDEVRRSYETEICELQCKIQRMQLIEEKFKNISNKDESFSLKKKINELSIFHT